MFLTADELIDMTGYRRAHEQRAWLDDRRWVYEVSRLGTVKVLRSYAEMKLGMPIKAEARSTEPDFAALGLSV